MEFLMQAYSTSSTEINCTCGYLPPDTQHRAPQANSELIYQIGNLLIALGSVFATVPLFKIHISQKTADLLLSIGTKLTNSVQNSSRRYC
jgi:hypothetical protein